MSDSRIPLYLITGFLDAGKTTLLSDTLNMDYFNDGQRTVLLLCEEGEEEYNPKALDNVTVVDIEDEAGLTCSRMKELEKKVRPKQVLIEYNGMWGMQYLRDMQLPRGWFLAQGITLVDAGTFDLYMQNMKSLFMDMVQDSDLVIFNRCKIGRASCRERG